MAVLLVCHHASRAIFPTKNRWAEVGWALRREAHLHAAPKAMSPMGDPSPIVSRERLCTGAR